MEEGGFSTINAGVTVYPQREKKRTQPKLYTLYQNHLKIDYRFKGKTLFFIIIFGCATWLVGSQFPDQRLNPGHGSERPES